VVGAYGWLLAALQPRHGPLGQPVVLVWALRLGPVVGGRLAPPPPPLTGADAARVTPRGRCDVPIGVINSAAHLGAHALTTARRRSLLIRSRSSKETPGTTCVVNNSRSALLARATSDSGDTLACS